MNRFFRYVNQSDDTLHCEVFGKYRILETKFRLFGLDFMYGDRAIAIRHRYRGICFGV